jgi:hypothetical protein
MDAKAMVVVTLFSTEGFDDADHRVPFEKLVPEE